MEHATAIDKALDVLFLLRRRGEPCGVTEIGRALSLPKSSAHRLLATLTRRGVVERDGRGRYRLGVGLMFLGQGVPEGEPLVVAARPVLEEEARALSETCFLVAARRGRLIVLDKVEAGGLLRVSPDVGAEIPAHTTAVGKLYRAYAPDLLDQAVERRPPRSAACDGPSPEPEDAVAADPQLVAVKADGYASNFGQWIEGLSVFSAPVFIHARISAALAVAVPSGRVDARSETALVGRLKDAAARIAARAEGREA